MGDGGIPFGHDVLVEHGGHVVAWPSQCMTSRAPEAGARVPVVSRGHTHAVPQRRPLGWRYCPFGRDAGLTISSTLSGGGRVQGLREWASVIATILLGIVGAYFSYSYGRQLRLSLASRRLEAYSKLWEATAMADPHRLDERTGLFETAGALDRSLTESERRALHWMLTTWYYKNGNGMLLTKLTRKVYLNAKHNLVCDDTHLKPDQFRDWLKNTRRTKKLSLTPKERGCFSIRQLSLLHTQMKTDLAIYGPPFTEKLAQHEVEFLRSCGVKLCRKPWREATRGRRGSDQQSDPEDDRAKNCGPVPD
jgi:hypothetical protein